MTILIASEQADHHLRSSNFEESLKHLEIVLSHFRYTSWHSIFIDTLKKAIACCEKLELFSKAILSIYELSCLVNYLTENEIHELYNQHAHISRMLPKDLTLDLDCIRSPISCEIVFSQTEAHFDEKVPFQLHIHFDAMELFNHFKLIKCHIKFSNSKNDFSLNFNTSSDSGSLQPTSFLLNTRRVFFLDLLQMKPQDEGFHVDLTDFESNSTTLLIHKSVQTKGKNITLHQVALVYSNEDESSLTLTFSPKSSHSKSKNFSRKWIERMDSGDIHQSSVLAFPPVLKFKSPIAKVSVQLEYSSPLIVDEEAPVDIILKNEELQSIEPNLAIEMLTRSSFIQLDDETFHHKRSIKLDVLQPGSTARYSFMMKFTSFEGVKEINVKLNYHLKGEVNQNIFYEDTLNITVARIFQGSYALSVHQYQPIVVSAESESHGPGFSLDKLLSVNVHINSPTDIEVKAIQAQIRDLQSLSHPKVTCLFSSADHFNSGVAEYKAKTILSFVLGLRLDTNNFLEAQKINLNVGELLLTWRRKSKTPGSAYKFVQSKLQISDIQWSERDVLIFPSFQPYVPSGQPFEVKYYVRNLTAVDREYCLSASETSSRLTSTPSQAMRPPLPSSPHTLSGLLYCGFKQFRFNLPPFGEKCFTYLCYPIVTGWTALPQLRLEEQGITSPGKAPSEIMVHGSVYVIPVI